MEGTPHVAAALTAVRHRATGSELADAALAMSGVVLPCQLLGGDIQRMPCLVETTSTAGGQHTDPGQGPIVELVVPDDVAASTLAAGALSLLDRETTPVATLLDVSSPGAGRLRGRLQADRQEESATFAQLRVSPEEVRRGGRRPLVVLCGRAPLDVDIQGVAKQADGRDVLWLVPVANSTPDGVPPGVLLAAVQAAVSSRPGIGHVSAVPLWWRSTAHDLALARSIAQTCGASTLLVLQPAAHAAPATVAPADGCRPPSTGDLDVVLEQARAPWRHLLDEVQAGAEDVLAPHPADDLVLQELRRWRPPRSRRGVVILLSGYSGSGKSTLARGLALWISMHSSRTVTLLDGDEVRAMLSSGLGFDRRSRELNVERIGFVAAEVARHGGIAICAPIAPYSSTRAQVRAMASAVGDFVLVHVATPLEVCEARDLKGLYARARAGLVSEFTGVSDPYEEPTDADLVLDTSVTSPASALGELTAYLHAGGWLEARSTAVTE